MQYKGVNHHDDYILLDINNDTKEKIKELINYIGTKKDINGYFKYEYDLGYDFEMFAELDTIYSDMSLQLKCKKEVLFGFERNLRQMETFTTLRLMVNYQYIIAVDKDINVFSVIFNDIYNDHNEYLDGMFKYLEEEYNPYGDMVALKKVLDALPSKEDSIKRIKI